MTNIDTNSILKGNRVLIAFGLLTVAVAALLGRRAYIDERDALIKNFRDETAAAVERVDALLDRMTGEFELEAEVFDKFLREADHTGEEVTEFLQLRTRRLSTAVDASFMDLYCSFKGKYHCGNYWRVSEDFNYLVRPWYTLAMAAEGRSAIVPPYMPVDYPHQVIAVSRQTCVEGCVLSMDVELSPLEPEQRDAIGGKGGVLFRLTPDGKVVTSSGDQRVFGQDVSGVIAELEAHEGTEFEFGEYCVFHRHTRRGWTVVLMQHLDDIYAPAWWAIAPPVIWAFALFAIVFLLFESWRYRRELAQSGAGAEGVRGKLLTLAVYVALGSVFLTLVWFGQRQLIKRDNELAVASAERKLLKGVEKYEAFIECARGAAGYCSRHVERMALAGWTDAQLTEETKALVGIYRSLYGRNYRNIYICSGEFYADSLGWKPPSDFTPMDDEFYALAVKNPNANVMTMPYASCIDGTRQISIARMINDKPHTVVGIDITVAMLQTLVRNLRLSGARCALVIAANGSIIEHHEIAAGGHIDHEMVIRRAMEERGSFDIRIGQLDYQVIAVPMSVGGKALVIGDKRMFDTAISGSRARTLLGAGIFIFFALALIYNAMRRIRIAREKDIAAAERTRQADALAKALDLAEAANRAKSVFLNSMSHDIRTPMNAIIGFTDLARRHLDETARLKDYLDKIAHASDHLLSLINQVLDMSRVESGKITLEPKGEDLRAIMNSIKTLMSTQAELKKLDFAVTVEKLAHPYVLCDRLRLDQVLINIVSNAIKYTPNGRSVAVRLREAPLAGEEGSSRYVFSIRDTGIGMSEEFCKTIFEPFTRERTATVSGIQGSGLGMTITKSMVDLMGGEISVVSKPGEGSEFTVAISLPHVTSADLAGAPAGGETADSAGAAAENGGAKSARLLLVEDNEINREIALEILTEHGYEVDWAENGAVAVEKVKRGNYALVLMDVQMPEMNGYEATQAIRAAGLTLPIVAMTANAFAEDRKLALGAGMNDHLAKPIRVPELMAMLKKYLEGAFDG